MTGEQLTTLITILSAIAAATIWGLNRNKEKSVGSRKLSEIEKEMRDFKESVKRDVEDIKDIVVNQGARNADKVQTISQTLENIDKSYNKMVDMLWGLVTKK